MKVQGEETFVTRKITRGLSCIDAGLENCLYLGNIDALRDCMLKEVEMQWLCFSRKPQKICIVTKQVSV